MQFGIAIACGLGGYVACWFTKDKITTFVVGAETQIRAFETKIKALKAKL